MASSCTDPPRSAENGDKTTKEPTSSQAAIEAHPFARSDSNNASFHELSVDETGLNVINRLDPTHPLRRLYYLGTQCGGVSVGDVNGDGAVDIFLPNGPDANRLFLQDPKNALRFDDVSAKVGVEGGEQWAVGAGVLDLDGDGRLDIYVCNHDSPNRLYRNLGNDKEGTPRFEECAQRLGLDISDASLAPAFCDYDGDGDLDIYLICHGLVRREGRPLGNKLPLLSTADGYKLPPDLERYYDLIRSPEGQYAIVETGRPNRLLQNNGPDGFTDVTEEAGLQQLRAITNSAIWWDSNRDGHPDLYVCNDFGSPDEFYRNNGDGTFENVLHSLRRTSWYSMGACAGDFTNDGYQDLISGDMMPADHFNQKLAMGEMAPQTLIALLGPPSQNMWNAFHINAHDGSFIEAAYLAGIAETGWTWSLKAADFDCDGHTDLFVTNGTVRRYFDPDFMASLGSNALDGQTPWDLYEDREELTEKNMMFRNSGSLVMENVATEWGLDVNGMSYGASVADLDRDGDLDLVVSHLNKPVSIYRNDMDVGASISLHLVGAAPNVHAIGAEVEVVAGDTVVVRQNYPVSGFLSSDDTDLHFGFGLEEKIDRITVRWPNGTVAQFSDLPIRHRFIIRQIESRAFDRQDEISNQPVPFYTRNSALQGAGRTEVEFDDFLSQPLLPNKLSQLGPALAAADLDGDGREDLYLGRSRGQSGAIYFNTGGRYEVRDFSPFEVDAECEDMGALFFDVDSDGDFDLYVASGSVEAPLSHRSAYRDRLYLNDGSGGFTKAPEDALPDFSVNSHAVAACDVDHDGDLDLLVGARSVPGQYPRATSSHLLRNDTENGVARFTDATLQWIPDLAAASLVNSALFSDTNGDGFADLLLATEWGPIRLFHNTDGQGFVETTEESGLQAMTGWWNGIAGRDIDNDGDIDYVATNTGYNTKYQPSSTHPVQLFYGNIDGSFRLLETEYEEDILYPIRGKGCSTRAIPGLSERFSTFRGFAAASFDDIYGNEKQELDMLAVNWLYSTALLNDGSGHFKAIPLPPLAQTAPGFGVILTEVDGDGFADCIIAQNSFSPQLETGRMAGGLSLLMRGNGDGTFEASYPEKSGISVKGDAKSLIETDLQGDGLSDIIVGLNNSDPKVFVRSQTDDDKSLLRVTLNGNNSNPTGIGARVQVYLENATIQTAEAVAGGGYLSQSTGILTFGTAGLHVDKVVVTWHDGETTTALVPSGTRNVRVSRETDDR